MSRRKKKKTTATPAVEATATTTAVATTSSTLPFAPSSGGKYTTYETATGREPIRLCTTPVTTAPIPSMRNPQLEMICRMGFAQLKAYLKHELDMIEGDGYLYRQGTVPVLLTAHLDTVHHTLCNDIDYSLDGKMSSPQGIGGDDRCGVYMIMQIIKEHNCSVLFCEDEEIGSIGAGKFIETDLAKSLVSQFNYIIELDRANRNDAVYYRCDNKDFEQYINGRNYWKTATGSFTDICDLAPFLKCAAVNFSCGYYKAHTKDEYIVLSEMEACITQVDAMLTDLKDTDMYDWVERPKQSYGSYSSYGYPYSYSDYSRYDDDDYWNQVCYGYSSKTAGADKATNNSKSLLDFTSFADLNHSLTEVTGHFVIEGEYYGKSEKITTTGATKQEALLALFVDYDVRASEIIEYWFE